MSPNFWQCNLFIYINEFQELEKKCKQNDYPLNIRNEYL